MTQTDSQPTRVHFRSAFTATVITQFVLVNWLAPGDGGQWLRSVIITLALFDIVVYLTLYSGPRQRTGTDPGLSLRGVVVLVAGSGLCIVFAPLLLNVLPLP